MKKLLIATTSFGADKKVLKNLKKKFRIITNKSGKKLSTFSLSNLIKNVHYVIAGTEIYNKDVLKNAKNLKTIFRFGSGTDNIDFNFCKKNNIKIKKINIDLSNSVAELAITLILNALKRIDYFNSNLKKSLWKKQTNSLINGKTLGVIGYGKIGKKLVNITKGFEMKYHYFDIQKKKTKIKYSSLKKIFKNSDIISIHQSYIRGKLNYIDKNFFNIAKKNLILINTSRGDVLNENDLYNFLKKNRYACAGIDVFKNEPYNGKLKNLRNIILTPHVGSYSHETRVEMERNIFRLILKEFK